MNWNKEKGTIYEALAVSVILLFFLCVFVLGIALPLRKSYSDEEKRELKHFPAFSVYAVLKTFPAGTRTAIRAKRSGFLCPERYKIFMVFREMFCMAKGKM